MKFKLGFYAMDYQQFITEIQNYWILYDKGLKKQANRFLFSFVRRFQEDVSEQEEDDILFQFCGEYIDGKKYIDANGVRRHWPFQMTALMNRYLNRECEKNKMPQMRWAFQISGFANQPNNPENDPCRLLEKAYMHEQCDQQTVDLYFGEQISKLWFGQHHFPDGCLITKNEYEAIVRTANRILSEKSVAPSLAAGFEYYVKLYHIYFEWREHGKTEDFYELCSREGIEYEGRLTIYYE